MLLHPLEYGSGRDPTFSHRGLVQKLPVGISTKESHPDFWHHLLRKSTSVTYAMGNTIAEHSSLPAQCVTARLGFKIIESIHLSFLKTSDTLQATLQT